MKKILGLTMSSLIGLAACMADLGPVDTEALTNDEQTLVSTGEKEPGEGARSCYTVWQCDPICGPWWALTGANVFHEICFDGTTYTDTILFEHACGESCY